MFPYSCPFCSQRLLALPDRVGQRTICPKCLRPLTIPRPGRDGEEAEYDATIDLDAPPPPRRPSGGNGNGRGYAPDDALAELSLSTAPAPEDSALDFAGGDLAGDELGRDSAGRDTFLAADLAPRGAESLRAEPPDDEVDLGLSGETPPPVEPPPAPARLAAPVVPLVVAPAPAPAPPRAATPPTVKMPRLPPAPERPAPRRLGSPAAPAMGSGVAGPRAHSPLPPRATARPTPPPTPPGATPAGASPGLPNGLLTGVPRDPIRPPAARLPRHETGTVSLVPTGLAGVDLNAELMANLTMRMKPPPEPAADLALSTGGLLMACAAAAALWVVGVLAYPRLLAFVAILGALMLAFGFAWAAYLVGRGDARRGLLALLPPVALWRIWMPFGDNRHGPLRFALCGALALALAAAGGPARDGVAAGLSALDFERPPPAASRDTLAVRLAAAAADRQADAALAELANLATPEYRAELSPAETPKIVEALKVLTRPEANARADVRLKATAALLEWSEADGRAALLRALLSAELTERRGAMALAPRWADEAVAAAVARRLSARTEETNARDALAQMPAALAETALLPMLNPDDTIGLLTVAEMLERVGGRRSLDALTALAKSADSPLVRDELTRHADALKARLGAK